MSTPTPASGSESGTGSNFGSFSGSSRTPGRLLDAAAVAVDDAVQAVSYDRLEPADLAAVVAGFRELFWHTTTLTRTLTDTYSGLTGLGHDAGHDPAASVTVIIERLTAVTVGLAGIDQALGDAHNHAAHLHQARC